MYDGINIFSDDIRVYEYALNQIPDRKNAIEPSYARNDTFEHALVVVENLFKRAQKQIYIKSSLFCKKFYLNDRIINTLNELKNKNKIKVNILIEQENSDELIGQKEAIEKFKEIFGKDNIKVNHLNNNKQQKVNDFIIIDEHDFRYELDEPKLFDSCKDDIILNTRASACFNAHKNKDNNRAIKLREVFEYLSV